MLIRGIGREINYVRPFKILDGWIFLSGCWMGECWMYHMDNDRWNSGPKFLRVLQYFYWKPSPRRAILQSSTPRKPLKQIPIQKFLDNQFYWLPEIKKSKPRIQWYFLRFPPTAIVFSFRWKTCSLFFLHYFFWSYLPFIFSESQLSLFISMRFYYSFCGRRLSNSMAWGSRNINRLFFWTRNRIGNESLCTMFRILF